MSFTRFNYDKGRTIKNLQQSTGPGRYILDVPGNGSYPDFISDPSIRIQKWGANMMTNNINIESELRGINRPINTDCIELDNYKNQKYITNTTKLHYNDNTMLTTDQSRVSHPAWHYRNLEQNTQSYLFTNPQEKVFIPFQNNISTRIAEKDNFSCQYDKY